MKWLRELRRRLSVLFRRGQYDRELEEEMNFHLEMQAQASCREDMDEKDAGFEARRRFGNTTLLKEASREVWGWRRLEELLGDVRFGLRTLRKSPGFSAAAILSLALGIGANTAVFGVIYRTLFKSLPVASPEELVAVYHKNPKAGLSSSSYPDFEFYRDHNEVFSGMLAYLRVPVILHANEATENVSGELVSPDYFRVLGVRPALGRIFTEHDGDDAGGGQVAVVSHDIWQDRFGGSPGIVGAGITVGRQPLTIVGVTPRGFHGVTLDWGRAPQIWLPVSLYRNAVPALAEIDAMRSWGMQSYLVLGRLRQGATLDRAQADLGVLFTRSAPLRGKAFEGISDFGPVLFPVQQARFWPTYRGSVVQYLSMLGVVAALVLLIACFNVANLILARGSRRRKELALRLSLGASRVRIARQLLVEGLLLSLLGGAAGLVLANWTAQFLASFPRAFLVPLATIGGPDAQVFGFAFAVSIVIGVLFGLAPLRQASHLDLSSSLKEGTGSAGPSHSRVATRDLLVVIQVALSLIMLIGAGLFLRTLRNAVAADVMTEPANLLLVQLDPRTQGYDEARCRLFYPQLLEAVGALPGVRDAALVFVLPLGGRRGGTNIEVEVPENRGQVQTVQVDFNVVTPGYFRTTGIPLRRGREFTANDRRGSAKVVVINETMAERFWPGEDAVGKRIGLTFSGPGNRSAGSAEVIGVVRDGHFRNLRDPLRPGFYVSLEQHPRSPEMNLIVRTGGDPLRYVAAVRGAARAVDPALDFSEFSTWKSHRDSSLAQERLMASLLTGFGVLALALASIGLYGVLSYAVAQRTREIGVRIALGADAVQVVRLVLGRGVALVFLGLALGVGAAIVLARFIATLLFGIGPDDPATIAGVSLLLLSIALLAGFIPAHRATRIDPLEALRHE